MKSAWALPALLGLSAAAKQAFSVNEDVLAFPQFEIRYPNSYVTEEQARSLLNGDRGSAHEEASDSTALQKQEPGAYQHQTPQAKEAVTYETLRKHGKQYLCKIPLVSPDGSDALEAAQAREQARADLQRARENGWELLSAMSGSCLYYPAGWWTYQYCYGQGVKQFHSLPAQPGKPRTTPRPDPNTAAFLLGEVDDTIATTESESNALETRSTGEVGFPRSHGGVENKAGVNYLVQHLEGGTICDLTGKPRKIEVQFHCSQTHDDHIELIKETATCAYLMVIKTPKLCTDIAFLPPQVDDPNYISCAPVLSAGESPGSPSAEAQIPNPFLPPPPVKVGPHIVGAHTLIPAERPIKRSAIIGGAGRGASRKASGAVLSSDGHVHDPAALQEMGLASPERLEKLKQQMERVANGQPWQIEVEGKEIRAIVGEEEEKDGGEKKGDSAGEERAQNGVQEGADTAPPQGSEEEYFPAQQVEEGEDENTRIARLGRELVEALLNRGDEDDGQALLFWDEANGEVVLDEHMLEDLLNALPRDLPRDEL